MDELNTCLVGKREHGGEILDIVMSFLRVSSPETKLGQCKSTKWLLENWI